MKTQPDKAQMEKAIQEAIKEAMKRVESKEGLFNANTTHAAVARKIARKHR